MCIQIYFFKKDNPWCGIKRRRDINRQFAKVNVQVTNTHMKRCSALMIINEKKNEKCIRNGHTARERFY